MAAPEKDFFTIAELLERWRYAGIDIGTLHKLAVDDSLVFSIYIRDIGSHTSTHETADGVVKRRTTTAFKYQATGYERPRLQYLRSDDARRILEAKPNEEILIAGHYSSPERTKESGIGYASGSPLLTKDDLVVSRAQRDLFEQKFKIRIHPPWYSRCWQWLANQENHRVLLMLSGWVIAIVTGAWAVWLFYFPQVSNSPATPNLPLQPKVNGLPSSGLHFILAQSRQPVAFG